MAQRADPRFCEYEVKNWVLLPAEGRRTHFFLLIYTEPGIRIFGLLGYPWCDVVWCIGWSYPRAVTGIMHGHNFETCQIALSSTMSQHSANAELHDAISTDTTIWYVVVFVSRLEYIMNCLAAGCSHHVPEAYLELVFTPTLLNELQAFLHAQGRAVRVSNNHQLC